MDTVPVSNPAASLGTKLNVFVDSLNFNSVIFLSLFVILINLGNTKKFMNVINIQNIIFLFIISVLIYFYLKKIYSKKISDVTVTQEFQQKRSVLDQICENYDGYNKNKVVCDKYKHATENFKTISDLLIKNIK